MRTTPLFDYVIFRALILASKCSYNVACATGVKRGGGREGGFRAHTQAITIVYFSFYLFCND